MKKTLLLACTIISFATISHAQIKKGSVLLGGSVGASSVKLETNSSERKAKSINISPAIGFAVKENLVTGVTTSFITYKSDPNIYGNKLDYDGFSTGLFARRYFPLSKSFYLYGNADVNFHKFSRDEISSTDYRTKTSSKGISLSIEPGITYAVSKRFHLEAALSDLFNASYSKSKREEVTISGSTTTNERNFNIGANLNTSNLFYIGFRLVLGK